MRTKVSSIITGILLMLVMTDAFAASKKNSTSKSLKSISQSIIKSESDLTNLVSERFNQAKSILENRIKKILDDFKVTNQTQNQAIIAEWQASRNSFLANLQVFSNKQIELNNASLQQLSNQSLASVAGATMASVNFLQFNYGRDSIRRTAPQHLQGMASLLRSGTSSVQGFITGFVYAETALRELSNSLSQVEGNIALESDTNTLLLQLYALQMQSEFVAFDAKAEANKARLFKDLLTRIKLFANQSSTNSQLQALIRSSDDRLYPVGALASVRSIISSSGTGWLTYAPEIYESVLLTTSFISEIHGSLAQMISSESQRIQTKATFDQIQYFRLLTNSSLRLIESLKNEFQRINSERERIAVLLANTASQIQNNPSTAGTRFQRLMSDLTSLRNTMRGAAEELFYSVEALTEEIVPLQGAAEASLNALGAIRTRYKASGSMIPIDYDLVNDFKYFLDDKDTITFGVIPNYWFKVASTKVKSQIGQSLTSNINRCLSLLADEDLLYDLKNREKRVTACLSRASKQIGKKQLASYIQGKIKKVSHSKFIETFENDFYGESLINYANTMNLNSEPGGEDAPFQDED